ESNLSLYYGRIGLDAGGDVGVLGACRNLGRAIGAAVLPLGVARLPRRAVLGLGVLALATAAAGQSAAVGRTGAGWLGLVFGAAAAAAALLYAALPWFIQPLLRLLLRLHYRVEVTGREHVPRDGPALVVFNHLTWLDGFFLAGFTPRRGKVLVSADIVKGPVLR